MSFVHVEDKLRFLFDDDWRVLKWDKHLAYVNGIQQFQGSKAIDFVGLRLAITLWLIEVKDPRGYRIEYKDRLANGNLVKQLAEKVRDTIAGLVWAHQRDTRSAGDLAPFVRALFDRDPSAKVFVVLWLEQDRPLRKDEAVALQNEIKRELIWLNPKVLVASRNLVGDSVPIPGLSVESLPGVGGGGRS